MAQDKRSRAYRLQSWLVVLLLVGIVGFVGYKVYDFQHNKPAASTATAAQDAAAALQLYDRLDGHTGDVADYQAAFGRAAAKCTNPPADVERFIENSQRDLTKNRVTDETALTLLSHLDQSIPAGTTMDCQGVLAAYLVLRER